MSRNSRSVSPLGRNKSKSKPTKKNSTKRKVTNQNTSHSRSTHKKHGILFGFSALLVASAVMAFLINANPQPKDAAFAEPPAAPSGKAWNLKWSDEFSGTSVDTSKWNVADNSNYGTSNKEDECYKAANTTVSGGSLHLTAKRQTVTCGGTNPDTGNSTYYFTSGMVTTRAQGGSMKYKFKQGYAEARVKAPKGNPYWSAFWLVSPNDGSTPGWPHYGEFDIFELYGARPDITTGTLHYGCTKSGGHCQTSPTWYNIKTDSAYGGTSTLGTQLTTQSAADSYSGGTADYQVYGFLWEANKISWYVNGRKFRYFDGTNVYRIEQNGSQTLENSTSSLGTPSTPFGTVFGYDHSIILNLAFGGNGPRYSYYGYTGYDSSSGYTNGNLAAVLPGNMDVDYVRVYQLETASSTTPATNPSPSPSSGSSSGSGSTAPSSTSSSSGGTNTTSGSTSTTNSSNSTTSSGTTASSTKPSTSTPPVTPGTAAVPIVVTKPNQTVAGTAVLSPTLSPTVTNTAVQKTIVKVDYLVDDKLQASDTAAPYGLDTTKLAEGAHAVTEKVSYQNGTTTQTTGKIVVDNKTASQEKKAQNMQLYAVSSGLGLATLVLLAVPITRSMIWYTLSYAPKKYLLHR